MKLWFVVPQYEEGAWVTEDEDSDTGYASEKLALAAKEALDAADTEAHQQRESKRLERSTLHRAARSILEVNGFQEVDSVIPSAAAAFEPRSFESRYTIIAVEIKE